MPFIITTAMCNCVHVYSICCLFLADRLIVLKSEESVNVSNIYIINMRIKDVLHESGISPFYISSWITWVDLAGEYSLIWWCNSLVFQRLKDLRWRALCKSAIKWYFRIKHYKRSSKIKMLTPIWKITATNDKF